MVKSEYTLYSGITCRNVHFGDKRRIQDCNKNCNNVSHPTYIERNGIRSTTFDQYEFALRFK
ncbi:hypothetical protein SFRURICE_019279 [Spodoptera frugiperda]|nr:hypothetical protein SFRURICE_019279 [Spodoptera frugiperda]